MLRGVATVPCDPGPQSPPAPRTPHPAPSHPATVTEIRAGVIDLFPVHASADGWRVLVLRRAPEVRCPGAWEVIHGSIETGETPPDAALRELREETGLHAERLYNLTAHAFYLHGPDVVQIAIAFCAFVAQPVAPKLGAEHDAAEWLPLDAALQRLYWPEARRNLADAHALLGGGDAGPAEDVLRVR